MLLQIVKWLDAQLTDLTLFVPDIHCMACKELLPQKINLHTEKVHDFFVKINSLSPDKLLAFYKEFDCYFKPALSERSDLKLLADKHCKAGITVEAWGGRDCLRCGCIICQ